MKLEEILKLKEDGYYSKWIPNNENQSSVIFKLFNLDEVPADGWEVERKETTRSYPSGDSEWTYYRNSLSTKRFRKQSGGGYVWGDVAERIHTPSPR